MNSFLFFSLLFILFACNNPKKEILENKLSTMEVGTIDTTNELETNTGLSSDYLKNRDFDGDGISDEILFNYSGGAHCCYSMSLKLSSIKDTIHYPFEMDGGYGFGIIDESQKHFEIKDFDNDGLPEIFMGISTYNGEENPIEEELTKTYGITTNYILLDYKNEKMEVNDYPQQ